jgi:hypothetical protein
VTLSFFDPPRRGELLYSALARYGRWKSLASPKAVMSDLFGRSSTIATLDLPNHLAELFARAPVIGRERVNHIIGRHTLFGYYTAFQPPERIEAARQAMMGVAGSLHLFLGIAAFRTGRPSHLQFCPDCLKRMDAEFSSFHWRADHQLPGVLVCPDHACRLRRSTVDLRSVNRHAFVAADHDVCNPSCDPVTFVLSHHSRDRALEIAKASALLLVPHHTGLTRDELRKGYTARLADAGFVRGQHKIDQIGLRAAFERHFGNLLERFAGTGLDNAVETWLNSIVRTSSGAHPPLHHILLGLFLNEAVAMPLRVDRLDGLIGPVAALGGGPDWRAIDLRYELFILRRAEELRRRSPPVKVTVAAIERGAGKRCWLTKRRAKLPLACRAMAEIAETTEAFQLRRLRWHIQNCLANGEFNPWVILRRAGLPHSHAPIVRSELSAAVARLPYAAYMNAMTGSGTRVWRVR